MVKNTSLGNVLKKIIGDLEEKEKKETDFLKAWENAVGEKAAKHARPASLKEKRLVVNVSDSTWLYKLTIEKRNIIEKLNKKVDKKKQVREIQFRIGNVS